MSVSSPDTEEPESCFDDRPITVTTPTTRVKFTGCYLMEELDELAISSTAYTALLVSHLHAGVKELKFLYQN